MTGILTEQKFISDCRYRVIESSSLVSILFREVVSHPYISFFHSLVIMVFVLLVYICVCELQEVVEEKEELMDSSKTVLTSVPMSDTTQVIL